MTGHSRSQEKKQEAVALDNYRLAIYFLWRAKGGAISQVDLDALNNAISKENRRPLYPAKQKFTKNASANNFAANLQYVVTNIPELKKRLDSGDEHQIRGALQWVLVNPDLTIDAALRHKVASISLVKFCLHLGADPHKVFSTILQLGFADKGLLESLTDKGVNLNQNVSINGKSIHPLQAAQERGHMELAALLENLGATLDRTERLINTGDAEGLEREAKIDKADREREDAQLEEEIAGINARPRKTESPVTPSSISSSHSNASVSPSRERKRTVEEENKDKLKKIAEEAQKNPALSSFTSAKIHRNPTKFLEAAVDAGVIIPANVLEVLVTLGAKVLDVLTVSLKQNTLNESLLKRLVTKEPALLSSQLGRLSGEKVSLSDLLAEQFDRPTNTRFQKVLQEAKRNVAARGVAPASSSRTTLTSEAEETKASAASPRKGRSRKDSDADSEDSSDYEPLFPQEEEDEEGVELGESETRKDKEGEASTDSPVSPGSVPVVNTPSISGSSSSTTTTSTPAVVGQTPALSSNKRRVILPGKVREDGKLLPPTISRHRPSVSASSNQPSSSLSSSAVVPYGTPSRAGELQTLDSKAADLFPRRVNPKENKDLIVSNAVWELEQGVENGDNGAVTKALSILEDAWKILAKSDYDPLGMFLNTYRINTDGDLLIHKAAETANSVVINTLVQKGARINVFNKHSETPIFNVVRNGQIDILRMIETESTKEELQKLLTKKNASGSSLLHTAARGGHIEIVNFLLMNASFNVNDVNKSGDTALHSAAQCLADADKCGPAAKIIETLLTFTTNVNAIGADNKTLLHFAAENGNVDLVKLLLARDADATCRDRYGNSALRLAAKNGHGPVVSLLLERPEVSRFDNNEEYGSLIHLAAAASSLEAVQALCQSGFDLCRVDQNDNTPLHLAVKSKNANSQQVAEFLYKKEPQALFILNKERKTPLHLVMEKETGSFLNFMYFWNQLGKNDKEKLSVVLYEFFKTLPQDKQYSAVKEQLKSSRPWVAKVIPSSYMSPSYMSPKLLRQADKTNSAHERKSSSPESVLVPTTTSSSRSEEAKSASLEPTSEPTSMGSSSSDVESTSLTTLPVIPPEFKVHQNAVQAIVEGYEAEISRALQAQDFISFLSLCYQLRREIGSYKQFKDTEPKNLITRGVWQGRGGEDVAHVLDCWNKAYDRIREINQGADNAAVNIWLTGMRQVMMASAVISELISPPEGYAEKTDAADTDPLLITFVGILTALWNEFDRRQFSITNQYLAEAREEGETGYINIQDDDKLSQIVNTLMLEAPALALDISSSELPIAGGSLPNQKRIAATALNQASPKHPTSSSSSSTPPKTNLLRDMRRTMMAKGKTRGVSQNAGGIPPESSEEESLFLGGAYFDALTAGSGEKKHMVDTASPNPKQSPQSLASSVLSNSPLSSSTSSSPVVGSGDELDSKARVTRRAERQTRLTNEVYKPHYDRLKDAKSVEATISAISRDDPEWWQAIEKSEKELEQIIHDVRDAHAWAATLGFDVQSVKGDGDCLFHAVSEQLKQLKPEGIFIDGPHLRRIAMKHMRNNQAYYANHLAGETVEGHADKMLQGKANAHADELDIQALSNALGVSIAIIQPPGRTGRRLIEYRSQGKDAPKAFVLYQCKNHYEALHEKPDKSALAQDVLDEYLRDEGVPRPGGSTISRTVQWLPEELNELGRMLLGTKENNDAFDKAFTTRYNILRGQNRAIEEYVSPAEANQENDPELQRAIAASLIPETSPVPDLPPLRHPGDNKTEVSLKRGVSGSALPATEEPLRSSSSSSSGQPSPSPIPQVISVSGVETEIKQPAFKMVLLENPAKVKSDLEERVEGLKTRQDEHNRRQYKLYKRFLEGARPALELYQYLKVEASEDPARSTVLQREQEAAKYPNLEGAMKELSRLLHVILVTGGVEGGPLSSLAAQCQELINRLPQKPINMRPRQGANTVNSIRSLQELLQNPKSNNTGLENNLEKIGKNWSAALLEEIRALLHEAAKLNKDWEALIHGEGSTINLVQAAQANNRELQDFAKGTLTNTVYPLIDSLPGDTYKVPFVTRSKAIVLSIGKAVLGAQNIKAVAKESKKDAGESEGTSVQSLPLVLAHVDHFKKSMPEKVWRDLGIEQPVAEPVVETKSARSTPEPRVFSTPEPAERERKIPEVLMPTPEPGRESKSPTDRPLSPTLLAREQQLQTEQTRIESYLNDVLGAENLSLSDRVAELREEQLKADLQQYKVLIKLLTAALPVIEAAADMRPEDIAKAEQKPKYQQVVGPCRQLADSIDYLSDYLFKKLQRAGKVSAVDVRDFELLKKRVYAAVNPYAVREYSSDIKALKEAIKTLRSGFPGTPIGTNPFQSLQSDLEQTRAKQQTLCKTWNAMGQKLSAVIEDTASLTQRADYSRLLFENVTGQIDELMGRKGVGDDKTTSKPVSSAAVHKSRELITLIGQPLAEDLDLVELDKACDKQRLRMQNNNAWKPAYEVGAKEAILAAQLQQGPQFIKAEQAVQAQASALKEVPLKGHLTEHGNLRKARLELMVAHCDHQLQLKEQRYKLFESQSLTEALPLPPVAEQECDQAAAALAFAKESLSAFTEQQQLPTYTQGREKAKQHLHQVLKTPLMTVEKLQEIVAIPGILASAAQAVVPEYRIAESKKLPVNAGRRLAALFNDERLHAFWQEQSLNKIEEFLAYIKGEAVFADAIAKRYEKMEQPLQQFANWLEACWAIVDGEEKAFQELLQQAGLEQVTRTLIFQLNTLQKAVGNHVEVPEVFARLTNLTNLFPFTPAEPAPSLAAPKTKPRRFEPAFVTKKPNAKELLLQLSETQNEEGFKQLLAEEIEECHELTGADLAAVLALALPQKDTRVVAGLVGMAIADPTLQPALLDHAIWLRSGHQIPLNLFLKAVQTNNIELVKKFIPLISDKKAPATNLRYIDQFLEYGLVERAINADMRAYLTLEQVVNRAIYSPADIGPQDSKSSRELGAFLDHAMLSRATFQRAYAIADTKPNLFRLLLSRLSKEDLTAAFEELQHLAKATSDSRYPLYKLLKGEVEKRKAAPSPAPLAQASAQLSSSASWYVVSPGILEENFNTAIANAKAGHPKLLEDLLARRQDLQGTRIHFLMAQARLELDANSEAHKKIITLFDESGIQPPGPLDAREAQQLYDTIASDEALLRTLNVTQAAPNLNNNFLEEWNKFPKEVNEAATITDLDARLEYYRKLVMDRESKVIDVDGVGKVRVYPHKGRTNLFLDQYHFFARGVDAARGALEIFKQAIGPEGMTDTNATVATQEVCQAIAKFHQAISAIAATLPQNERLKQANTAYKAFEAQLVALLIYHNACGPQLKKENENLERATLALEMVRDFMYERTFHEEVSCVLQPMPRVQGIEVKGVGHDWVLHVQRPVTLSFEPVYEAPALGAVPTAKPPLKVDNRWDNYQDKPWFSSQEQYLVGDDQRTKNDNWLRRFTKAHFTELQTIPSTSISRATPRSGNAMHCSRVQIIDKRVDGPVFNHTREGIVDPLFHKAPDPKNKHDRLLVGESANIARYNRMTNVVGYRGETLRVNLEKMLNSGIPPEQIRSILHHTLISFDNFKSVDRTKSKTIFLPGPNNQEVGDKEKVRDALEEWLQVHSIFYTTVDSAPAVVDSNIERKDGVVPSVAPTATPRYQVMIASSPAEKKDLEAKGYSQLRPLASETSNDAVNLWGAGHGKVEKKPQDFRPLEAIQASVLERAKAASLIHTLDYISQSYLALPQVRNKKEGVMTGDILTPLLSRLLPRDKTRLEQLKLKLETLDDALGGMGELAAGVVAFRAAVQAALTEMDDPVKAAATTAEIQKNGLSDFLAGLQAKGAIKQSLHAIEMGYVLAADKIVQAFAAVQKAAEAKTAQGKPKIDPSQIPYIQLKTAVNELQKIQPRSPEVAREILLLQAVVQLTRAKQEAKTGEKVLHSGVRPSVQTAVATEIVGRLTGIYVGGCMSSCDRAPDIDAVVNYNLMAFQRWGKIVSYDNSIQIIPSEDGTLILKHTDPVTKKEERLVVEGPTAAAHISVPGWITKPEELLGLGIRNKNAKDKLKQFFFAAARAVKRVDHGATSGLAAANETMAELEASVNFKNLRDLDPDADAVKQELTRRKQSKEAKESSVGYELPQNMFSSSQNQPVSRRPMPERKEEELELIDFLREDKTEEAENQLSGSDEYRVQFGVDGILGAAPSELPPDEDEEDEHETKREVKSTEPDGDETETDEEELQADDEREEAKAHVPDQELLTDDEDEETDVRVLNEELLTDDEPEEAKAHEAESNVTAMDPSLWEGVPVEEAQSSWNLLDLDDQKATADIFQAAARGNLKLVQAIIKKDPTQIDARDGNGRTPLMYAAAHARAYEDRYNNKRQRHDQADVIDYLIAQDADVTTWHNDGGRPGLGYSALTYAVGQGRLSAVRALCFEPDQSADQSIRGGVRATTIYLFKLRDPQGRNLLIHAIAVGNRALSGREKEYCDVITELLEIAKSFPAQINHEVDRIISEALRYAAEHEASRKGILNALCAGATPAQLQTALRYAVRADNKPMVEAILQARPWGREMSGYSREEFLGDPFLRAVVSKRAVAALLKEALGFVSLNEAAAKGDLAAVQQAFDNQNHPDYKNSPVQRRAAAHEALAYAVDAAYYKLSPDELEPQAFKFIEDQNNEVINWLIENQKALEWTPARQISANEWDAKAEAPAGYDALRRAALTGNAGAINALLLKKEDKRPHNQVQAAAMLTYGQPVTDDRARNESAYALTYAVQSENSDAVQAILSAMSKCLEQQQFQDILTDALRYAAHHHKGMLEILCKNEGVNNEHLNNALETAIVRSDVTTVTELLKVSGFPSTPPAVLLTAIKHGSAKVVTTLLTDRDYRIDPHMRDADGNTLLMLAAHMGRLETVKAVVESSSYARATLVRKCRHPDQVRGLENPDAMTLAYVNGHRAVVDYLRNLGIAEPEFLQQDIYTAAHQGNLENVQRCLTATNAAALNAAALNQRDGANQYTPLMYAAAQGHVNVVNDLMGRPLIQANRSVPMIPAERKGGQTALMLAARNGYAGVITALLYRPLAEADGILELRPEAVALLRHRDGKLNNALMHAIQAGQAEAVGRLLEAYADITRGLVDRAAIDADLQQAVDFIAGHKVQGSGEDLLAFETMRTQFCTACVDYPHLLQLSYLLRTAVVKNNPVLVKKILVETAERIAAQDPQTPEAWNVFHDLCRIALKTAAVEGRVEIVQTIESAIRMCFGDGASQWLRAHIESRPDMGQGEGADNPNALRLAIQNGKEPIANIFREKIDISDVTLNQAARDGNLEAVKACFENPLSRHYVPFVEGANPAERRLAAALEALEYAATGNSPNHVAVVKELLGAVTVDQVAGYKALSRAISRAISGNNNNIVVELLRWNRDPDNNQINVNHHNPLVRGMLVYGEPRPAQQDPAAPAANRPYILTRAVKANNPAAVRTIIGALNQALSNPVGALTRQNIIYDALRYAAQYLPAAQRNETAAGVNYVEQAAHRELWVALLAAQPADIGAALERAAAEGNVKLVNMLEHLTRDAQAYMPVHPAGNDENGVPLAPPLPPAILMVNANRLRNAYILAARAGQVNIVNSVSGAMNARGITLLPQHISTALREAAEAGHVNIVGGIVARYYETPAEANLLGEPLIQLHLSEALTAAINHGHPGVVQFLLEHNAPLPAENVQCAAGVPHAANVNNILAAYHRNNARREALARELDPWGEQRQEAGAAAPQAQRPIPVLATHLNINVAPLANGQQLQFNPTIIDEEGLIAAAEAKVAAAQVMIDHIIEVRNLENEPAFNRALPRIQAEAARVVDEAQAALNAAPANNNAAEQGRFNQLTAWNNSIQNVITRIGCLEAAENLMVNERDRCQGQLNNLRANNEQLASANADTAAERAADTIKQDWDQLGLDSSFRLHEAVLYAAQRVVNNYPDNSPEKVAAQGLVTEIRTAFAEVVGELGEQRARDIVNGVYGNIHGDAVAQDMAEDVIDALDAVCNAAVAAINPAVAGIADLRTLRNEAVSAERWRSAKKAGIGLGVVLTAGGVAAATAVGQGPANLLDAMGGRGQDLMKAYGWGTGTAKIAGAATLSELMQKAQDNSPYHQSPLVRVFTAKRILDETIQGLGRAHAKESLLDLETVNGPDANHRPAEVRAALVELIEARLYYHMLWRKKYPPQANALADREERLLPEQAVYALSQLREKLKGNEALTAQELQQVKMTYNTVLAIRDPHETNEKKIGKRAAGWFGAGVLVSLLGAVAFIYGLDPDNKLMNQLRQWVDDGVPNVEGTGQDIAERNAKVESFVMAILSVVPAIAVGVAWLMISRAFIRNCKTYEDFKRADETLSRIRSGVQRKDREGFDYNQKIDNITTVSRQDWWNFCFPSPPAGQSTIVDWFRGFGGIFLFALSFPVVPVAYMLAAIGSNKNLGADWVPTGGTFFAPESVRGWKRAFWYGNIIFPLVNAALWVARGLIKLAFYLPARLLQHVYQAFFLTVPDNAPQFVKDYYNNKKARGEFGPVGYLWEVAKRLLFGGNYLENTNQYQHSSVQNLNAKGSIFSVPEVAPEGLGAKLWYGAKKYFLGPIGALFILRHLGTFFSSLGVIVLNVLPKSWKPESWSTSEKLTISYNIAAIVVGVLLVVLATAVVGAVLSSPLTAAIIGVGVFGSLANIFASAIIVGLSILLPRIWKFLKNSFSNTLREDALRAQESLPAAEPDNVEQVQEAEPAAVQDLAALPPLPEPPALEPQEQPTLQTLELLQPENRAPVTEMVPAPVAAEPMHAAAASQLAELAELSALVEEEEGVTPVELREHIQLPVPPALNGDIFVQPVETHELGIGVALRKPPYSHRGSDAGSGVSSRDVTPVPTSRAEEREIAASTRMTAPRTRQLPLTAPKVVQLAAPQPAQQLDTDTSTREHRKTYASAQRTYERLLDLAADLNKFVDVSNHNQPWKGNGPGNAKVRDAVEAASNKALSKIDHAFPDKKPAISKKNGKDVVHDHRYQRVLEQLLRDYTNIIKANKSAEKEKEALERWHTIAQETMHTLCKIAGTVSPADHFKMLLKSGGAFEDKASAVGERKANDATLDVRSPAPVSSSSSMQPLSSSATMLGMMQRAKNVQQQPVASTETLPLSPASEAGTTVSPPQRETKTSASAETTAPAASRQESRPSPGSSGYFSGSARPATPTTPPPIGPAREYKLEDDNAREQTAEPAIPDEGRGTDIDEMFESLDNVDSSGQEGGDELEKEPDNEHGHTGGGRSSPGGS